MKLSIQARARGARSGRGLALVLLASGLVAGGSAVAKEGDAAQESAAAASPAGHVHASVVIQSKMRNPARYPPMAFRDDKEGEAIILIKVDAQGQWAAASVLQSTGWPELDEAAMAATRTWEYNAASQDGRPVPGEVRVPVVFKKH